MTRAPTRPRNGFVRLAYAAYALAAAALLKLARLALAIGRRRIRGAA